MRRPDYSLGRVTKARDRRCDDRRLEFGVSVQTDCRRELADFSDVES